MDRTPGGRKPNTCRAQMGMWESILMAVLPFPLPGCVYPLHPGAWKLMPAARILQPKDPDVLQQMSTRLPCTVFMQHDLGHRMCLLREQHIHPALELGHRMLQL